MLADHQGTIRDLVDGQLGSPTEGEVVNHLTYDAYGQLLDQTASDPAFQTRYGYTGQELDAETGLMYYNARWYDTHNGRFISEDPIGINGGDYNLSRYVVNSPTNGTDPSGLRVLVASRDLNLPFGPGSHSFLIVIPDNPGDFVNLRRLGVDQQGNPIMGFTVAGHNRGCLSGVYNEAADLEATRELIDTSYSIRWWQPNFSATLEAEIPPPRAPGSIETQLLRPFMTDSGFIREIIRRVNRYNARNIGDLEIEYKAFRRNCNVWTTSLLSSFGISRDWDFSGYDPGSGKASFRAWFYR